MKQDPVVQYIIMNTTVMDKMGRGAIGAQVAHASMAPILKQFLAERDKQIHIPEVTWEWINGTFTKIVLGCSHNRLEHIIVELHEQQIEYSVIRESRLDDVITGIGLAPMRKSKLVSILGKLRTLV